MSALVASGMTRRFGANVAVDDVSIEMSAGQVLGIIGPNGSGKTTLFNLITGALRADTGAVQFDGRDVTGWRSPRRARAGLARTFQQSMVFPRLTVAENIDIARHGHDVPSWVQDAVASFDRDDLAHRTAGKLPYGTQRRLGVLLALCCRPKALLLDEPGAGLNDSEVSGIGELIRLARDDGIAVGLIDHNMSLLLPYSDAVVGMDVGRVIFSGTPDEVMHSPEVLAAYFGQRRANEATA